MKEILAFLPLKNTISFLWPAGLFSILYLVSCSEVLFTSSPSRLCDEGEGGACEEYSDPKDIKRSSSRRGGSRSRRSSSRSSDRSDRREEGRVFTGGNDLTVAYCSSQIEEFLEVEKRYHLEEVKTHTFRAKYNALWTARYRLGSEVSQSVKRKFKELNDAFRDFNNRDHGQLNTEYVRFRAGEIDHERMREEVESHENSFDSIESKYSNSLSEWFDRHVSEQDKKNTESEHEKLIVQIGELFVESCDFVLEACNKLINDDRLTEDVSRLKKEHDRLWKESVRLLEEFNRTQKRHITGRRLQVVKRIRTTEKRILDEL